MIRRKQATYLLSFLSLLALASCSRPNLSRSKLTLSLPKQLNKSGAFSANELQRVMINITGPGISSPQVLVWDADAPGGACGAAGTDCEVTVATGSARLFQVLAVFRDSATKAMEFAYGDASKDLAAASESVSITIAPLGTSGVTAGRVMGRYVTSMDAGLPSLAAGPTGDVKAFFAPGGGKPPVLVQTESMYNGWFSLFMLYGARLKYVLNDGTVLFGGAVDLSDPLFTAPAAGTSLIERLDFPLRDELRRADDGTKYWQVGAPQSTVYGWFIDPVLTLTNPSGAASFLTQVAVCFPYPTTSKEGVYATMTSSPTPNTSPYPSEYLNYSPVGVTNGVWAGPTPAALAAGGSYYHYTGAPNVPSTLCASTYGTASDQLTTISLTSVSYDGSGGGDVNPPLRPPFRLNPPLYYGAPPEAFTKTLSGGAVNLSAAFLEGAHWDAVTAYYKTGAQAGKFNRTCGDLAEGGAAAMGYAPLPASLGAAVTSSAGLSLSVSPTLSSNQASVQLCGVKNGVRFSKPFAVNMDQLAPPVLMATTFRSTISVAGNRGNLVVDSQNNIYYSNVNGWAVMKITPAGVETTFSGGQFDGNYTDGAANTATFLAPQYLAIDGNDNIYVADGLKVRKLAAVTGAVTTIGQMAAGGNCQGIAVDSSGNVFFVWDDATNTAHSIQKMTPGGVVSTFAGSTTSGNVDGAGASARFNNPADMVFDSQGNLYVADTGNFSIRKITPAGTVTTLAGDGTSGYQNGTGATARFSMYNSSGFPAAHMGIDGSGFIYLNDVSSPTPGPKTVRKIDTATGAVTTFCGAAANGSNSQGPCADLNIVATFGLTVDHTGKVYFAPGGTVMVIK